MVNSARVVRFLTSIASLYGRARRLEGASLDEIEREMARAVLNLNLEGTA
jgi:hypothetical protein